MGRAGDDVAFGLENRGVARRRDLAAGSTRRSPLSASRTAATPPPARSPAASSSGWRWPASLALRPGLLLLDEVTANLDPAGVALVRAVLADVLASTGATAVVVEHRVEQVVDLVTRAVVLEPGGGVVADGSARRGLRQPGRRTGGCAACGCRAAIPPYAGEPPAPPGPALLPGEAVRFRYPACEPGRAGADRPRPCGPAPRWR